MKRWTIYKGKCYKSSQREEPEAFVFLFVCVSAHISLQFYNRVDIQKKVKG